MKDFIKLDANVYYLYPPCEDCPLRNGDVIWIDDDDEIVVKDKQLGAITVKRGNIFETLKDAKSSIIGLAYSRVKNLCPKLDWKYNDTGFYYDSFKNRILPVRIVSKYCIDEETILNVSELHLFKTFACRPYELFSSEEEIENILKRQSAARYALYQTQMETTKQLLKFAYEHDIGPDTEEKEARAAYRTQVKAIFGISFPK